MNYTVYKDTGQDALTQLLVNRGIALEDVPHYLNVSEEDLIDPALLKNIDWGANLLLEHIKQKDLIYIKVDDDCDGFTSAAILVDYIIRAFGRENVNLIYDFYEGKTHGLAMGKIPEEAKLVIVPDAAFSSEDVYEDLIHRGVDILQIDHHPTAMPYEEVCFINPHFDDYPNKKLSGAGLVWKFCCYLDSVLGVDYAEEFLDLAATGIVADMIDLRSFETRYIVQQGLKKLRAPFFFEYAEKIEDRTPIFIAFRIAPLINAVARCGTPREKKQVFRSLLECDRNETQEIETSDNLCRNPDEKDLLSSIPKRGFKVAETVYRQQSNKKRKAIPLLEKRIVDGQMLNNQVLLFALEPNEIDRNIAGLCANAIVNKYMKPTIILTKQENGTYAGSARNVSKTDFEDFRKFIDDSGFAEYAEGHGAAFGVCFAEENLKPFVEYANEQLKDYRFEPCYFIDKVFEYPHLDEKFIKDLADREDLYGQGIDAPLIMIKNYKAMHTNVEILSKDKHPTLKFTFPNGIKTTVMKFGSSLKEYRELQADKSQITTLNIIGSCATNNFLGKTNYQLITKAYEIVDEKNDWYF